MKNTRPQPKKMKIIEPINFLKKNQRSTSANKTPHPARKRTLSKDKILSKRNITITKINSLNSIQYNRHQNININLIKSIANNLSATNRKVNKSNISNYTIDDDSTNHINLKHITDKLPKNCSGVFHNDDNNEDTEIINGVIYTPKNLKDIPSSNRNRNNSSSNHNIHCSSFKRINTTMNCNSNNNSHNINHNNIHLLNKRNYSKDNNDVHLDTRRNRSALLTRNTSPKYKKVTQHHHNNNTNNNINNNNNDNNNNHHHHHHVKNTSSRSNQHTNHNNNNNNTNQIKISHLNLNLFSSKVSTNNKCIGDRTALAKIILIVKSNWGSSNQLSLFNIVLFDNNDKKIPIKKSNIEIGKQYTCKFSKGDIKNIYLYYDNTKTITKMTICNGYNETGICQLEIKKEGVDGILWRGIMPKCNVIKPHLINLNTNGNNSNSNNKTNRIMVNRKILKLINNNNNNNTQHIHSQTTKSKSTNKIKSSYININDNTININNNNNNNITQSLSILTDKLRINILSIHNNNTPISAIGLTGIELIDIHNSLIKPKSFYVNLPNHHNHYTPFPIENLFNNKNHTTNPKQMFILPLSSSIPNTPSPFQNPRLYIDIKLKKPISLKQIRIYNINNAYYRNNSIKEIQIHFYIESQIIHSSNKLFLFIAPFEDGIDYSQVFTYPFLTSFQLSEEIIKHINEMIIYNRIVFNNVYQYYTPLYPCGFIIKIEIDSNYGDKRLVGFDKIEIVDVMKREVVKERNVKKKMFALPKGGGLKEGGVPFYLSEYINVNKKGSNYNLSGNRILFVFNEIVILSKIVIMNYSQNENIGCKFIHVLVDDKVVFEGELVKSAKNEICFCHNVNDSGNDTKDHNMNNINNNMHRYEITNSNKDIVVLKKMQ